MGKPLKFLLFVFLIFSFPISTSAQESVNGVSTEDSIAINQYAKNIIYQNLDSATYSANIDSLRRVMLGHQYPYGEGLLVLCKIKKANNVENLNGLLNEIDSQYRTVLKDSLISQVYLEAAYRHLTLAEDYVVSLQLAQKYIEQYQELEDFDILAKFWNIKGEVYRSFENHNIAHHSYLKAIEYGSKKSVPYLAPYINIATVYKSKGELDSAVIIYDSLLNFIQYKAPQESRYLAYIHNRLAQTHLLKKNLSLSEDHLHQSYEYIKTSNSVSDKILYLSTLSMIYNEKQMPDSVIKYGSELIDLTIKEQFYIEDISHIARTIASIYFERNELKKAYEFQSKNWKIFNKRYNSILMSKLVNYQVEQETKNKNKENNLLKDQMRLKENQIQQQKYINILIAIGGGVLLVLVFFSYQAYQFKTKTNRALIKKNRLIIEQSEEIKSSNERIKLINDNLEDMVHQRSKIIKNQNDQLRDYAFSNAHKVRGPLARIIGLMNIIDYELPGEESLHFREMLKSASNDLDEAIKEINDLLEKQG